MNLEYCHLYYTECIKNTEIIKDTLLKEKHLFDINKKENNIILIDDKYLNLSTHDKEIFNIKLLKECSTLNMTPHHIFYEDYFNNLADYVFDNIPKKYITKEFFRKENKYVYFINYKNNKFSLREEKDNVIKNYCVLLSTAWSIYKFYYFGDNYTIINKEFDIIEKRVSIILNSLKLNINNIYFTY